MNLAFIQGIGPLEMAIVLIIVLLIVGPKRLPGVARSVGSGMREFKDSVTGGGDKDEDASPKERIALASSDDEPKPAAKVATEPVATERV